MTSSAPSVQRHLVHVFPTFAVGGSQIRFAQLAAAHGPRYRHSVVALDGVTTMRDRISKEVAISLIEIDFDKKAGLKNLPLFRRKLRDLNPDLIVTYNWGSIEWCLANRLLPVARHTHIEDGFGPEEKTQQFPRRVWTRRLALTGRHTTIVLPSRQLETMARNVWRLPPSRIKYVPNGVNIGRFTPDPQRPAHAESVVIGTVATLRPEKNLIRLINAFAAIAAGNPAVSLLIVGDGPERPALEAAAKATGLGERIIFPGPTSAPETALAEIDIFALTSDTEQMPLSILEAMAAHLPIVSVNVGDVIDMVSDANRIYVTPLGDDAALIGSLKRLIADPFLRKHLGQENGLAAASRFDQSVMIQTYQTLFG